VSADAAGSDSVLRKRRRALNGVGVLVCGGLIAYALYEQHMVGLEPCHLCVLQRIAVLLLGLLFLIAAWHGPREAGARVYGAILAMAAAAGMLVAGRHVWLQHLPPGSVPSCGADLEFMLKVMPLHDVLVKVFKGGAECQTVDWSLLGLSMPAWLFLVFAALGIGALLVNCTQFLARR